MNTKKKRSIPLIISAVLGVWYSIYITVHFGGAMFGSSSMAELAGGAIATALVTPHMVCVVVAAIFNTVACFTNKPAFALVGGILYSVGAVVFLLYALFVVPSIILSFAGYAQLKKAKAQQQPPQQPYYPPLQPGQAPYQPPYYQSPQPYGTTPQPAPPPQPEIYSDTQPQQYPYPTQPPQL